MTIDISHLIPQFERGAFSISAYLNEMGNNQSSYREIKTICDKMKLVHSTIGILKNDRVALHLILFNIEPKTLTMLLLRWPTNNIEYPFEIKRL